MKFFKRLVGLGLVGLLLTGCGAAPTGSGDNPPAESGTEPQVVLVGTEGTYSPFTFQDEEGNLTGYDIDVIKAIDERIADVEFEFLPTPWDSMFLGLESGKYDLVANQIAKNPEREEKYIFTENSYFVSAAQIIVSEDFDQEVNGIDDLKGLRIGTSVGSNYTKLLEDYNAENNNALILQYYDGNIVPVLQDLEVKRIDATLNERTIVADSVQKLGLKIKLVGEPADIVPSYLVFRKDSESEDLRDKIDKALKEIIEDGTLREISVKWFGEDFTK